MISTLRARLFISTASIGIAVMAVFILTLSIVGGPLISRPIVTSVRDAAVRVRASAAAAPANETFDALVRRIVRDASNESVDIAVIPPSESLRVPPHPPRIFDLGGALGIRGEAVPLRGSLVLIVPAFGRVNAAIEAYLFLVAIAVVISLAISFVVARWSATQAILPLLAVTKELERFAAGDLRERALRTDDRGEVGALTVAFNGAARQVARSFAERALVEVQMRQFVSDASHELRTPLTVVGGFIDVLHRGAYADPEIRESAFTRIATEITRMRHLIDRLIVLASTERMEPVVTEVVEISDVAREAIAARADGNAVALRAGTSTYVRADPNDIFEAIGNLVENATKYGSDASVSIEHEAGLAVVRVSDRGPGIASNDVDKIFQRFYRCEKARDIAGSGLGLSIAQSATQRAGGTLVLEDARVGRTTFALRLPLLAMEGG